MRQLDNIDTIKNYVYTLLQQEPSGLLELQIESAIDEILAYLYRDEIPCELERPMATVIANGIKTASFSNGIDGDIQSYSEGDMSISFGGGLSSSGVKYGGRLEGFKLIRGAKCSDTTNVL